MIIQWQTFIRKDAHKGGFKAESIFSLGGNLRLKVSTFKIRGGLTSVASVCKVEGIFETHALYQDYYERLINSNKQARANAVAEQHNKALTMVQDLLPAIEQQYGVNLKAA